MKLLINLILLIGLISCSSIQQEKRIEKSISETAYGYLTSAEKMYRADLLSESVDLYEKASKLFLSKLLYREFSLSQLKKTMVLLKKKDFVKARKTIDFVLFCDRAFALNLGTEIKGVELRYNLASDRNEEAKENLRGLLAKTLGSNEKQAYFNSVRLRLEPAAVDKKSLRESFIALFKEYQSGLLENKESFIYVGQGLLDTSASFDKEVFGQLAMVATDLEIKSLSRYLLAYQKKFSSTDDKPMFQKLIDKIDKN